MAPPCQIRSVAVHDWSRSQPKPYDDASRATLDSPRFASAFADTRGSSAKPLYWASRIVARRIGPRSSSSRGGYAASKKLAYLAISRTVEKMPPAPPRAPSRVGDLGLPSGPNAGASLPDGGSHPVEVMPSGFQMREAITSCSGCFAAWLTVI